MLTFEQIKELIEIVAQKQLTHLELERSGFSLKIEGREGRATQAAAPVAVAAVPAAPAAAPVAPPPAVAAAETQPAEPDAADEGLHVLNSPIVGTFYSSPSPDADPFARAGDRVKKGQVLCIVEAMKLMNEIESDVDGVLREVYPKNAQPVEFGEPLFAIDPE